MGAHVHNVTFDCADAYALAQFWSEVTGYPMGPDDQPGDDETGIDPPDGNGLPMVFLEVPEPKTVKNRVHVCLYPNPGTTRDEEVTRLLGIGAQLVDDLRTTDGKGWTVLSDPEGNEFCACAVRPNGQPTPDRSTREITQ